MFPKILSLFILIQLAAPCLSQESTVENQKRFYLENTLRPKKQVTLNNRKKILLQVDETAEGGQHLAKINSIECRFDSLRGDSLILALISEEIEIDYKNKFTGITHNYFTEPGEKVNKTVALKDILYVNTKNPLRQTLTQTASVIMALSIVTIVSAPLAGLSLPKEQKAAARTQVFMVGVSGFAFSIPLFILGKNKKYGISEKYMTRSGNYWKVNQRTD